MLFKGPKSLLDSITNVIKEERAQYAKEQAEMDKLVAEKMLSPKQKKIAKVAGDSDKIDAADFAALRSGKKMNSEGYNAKREHELNMDAAQRHMDRRAAEGEDMTGAKIHPKTYEIIMPKSTTKKMAKEEVELDEDKSSDSERKRKQKELLRQAERFEKTKPHGWGTLANMARADAAKLNKEEEHIDETLGATLRKYVPGLGKDELKKRYLDADTRTRYTLGKAPENHTDADKKELEMHAKKLRRYGKLVDKHIGEAYDDEQIDEISDAAKRNYLSKIPASVTKIQKNAEKEITTNPDQGKGLSNALKGLAKINKRGEIANKVRQSLKNEATDTPGNGREHQCAIHVKNEQFGEGKTLTTQHAEPDENGDIAWYDVMFDHGIERIMTEDLDILVSEAHFHNKPKKGM